MRSAEDYIKDIGGFTELAFSIKYRNKPSISIEECVKMINEARKEAIEACAEAATTKHVHVGQENKSGVEVDKQSILKLIDLIQ